MKCKIIGMFLSWITVVGTASAQWSYTVNITAPTAVKPLLENYLDIKRWQDNPDMSAEQLEHLISSTPDQAQDLLATQGYFSPVISTAIDDHTGRPTVMVSVEPGPTTKVSNVNRVITGVVTKDSAFADYQKAVRHAWPLRPHHVFTQSAWNTAKRSGELILSREKYARAKLTYSQARIIPETQQADLSVTYDSGPIYTIGAMTIKGLDKYPDAIVLQQIRFNQGDYYVQEKLFELQSTLQNFPHFTSAIVEVDFEHEKIIDPDHVEAPVIVTVQEAPLQKVNMGLGYGSDSGARGEIYYQYNNVAKRGWVFSANIKADRLEKSGTVILAIPKRRSGYEDSFYAQYKQSDIENLFSKAKTIAARRTRKKGLIETEFVLDYTLERQLFDDGTWEQPQALVVNYKWIRRDIDNIANPRRGNMLWLEAGMAGERVLSDTTFMRFHGIGTMYWKLGKKNNMMGRVEIGQVFAGNERDIPSKWLFRAGGSNSVRGYAYESLGVNRLGSTVGGRVIGTATVEYQHVIYQNWRGAIFIDAGDAAKQWQSYSLHTGAGLGARWTSPVGVFGADLGYGFQEKGWRFYLSMGLTF